MSFSDPCKGANGLIGYNADDPDRADNNVNSQFTFSAKPRGDTSVSFDRKAEQEVAKDGTTSELLKTTGKLSHTRDGVTATFTFANDKMGVEAKGKAYDEDGWTVGVSLGGDLKQAAGKWTAKGALDIGGKDVGGAKLGFGLPFEYNQKGETTLKPKLSLDISDDFAISLSTKTDTKALQEIWPQLRYRFMGDNNSYSFLRADVSRKTIGAGCWVRHGSFTHAYEAVYDRSEGFKGAFGFPVIGRGGLECELSESTSLEAQGSYGASYSLSSSLSHAYDKNWTISASQSFDSEGVGSPAGPYHVGFAASYKL